MDKEKFDSLIELGEQIDMYPREMKSDLSSRSDKEIHQLAKDLGQLYPQWNDLPEDQREVLALLGRTLEEERNQRWEHEANLGHAGEEFERGMEEFASVLKRHGLTKEANMIEAALLPGEPKQYVEQVVGMANEWSSDPEKWEQWILEQPFLKIESTYDNLWDIVKHMRHVKHPEIALVEDFQKEVGHLYKRKRDQNRGLREQEHQDYKFQRSIEDLASLLHSRGLTKEANMILGLIR